MDNINSFKYELGSGGFNYSKNLNSLNPGCMIPASYNFNLLPDSIRARGGTKILYNLNEVSPVTSLTQIFNQYDNESIVSTTQSGKIFKNTTLLRELPLPIYDATSLLWNENLIINSGNNIPQGWDGLSLTTEDFPTDHMAPDWVLDNYYPILMVRYGKGNSVRAWAIGSTKRKTTLYFSTPSDGLDPYPNFKDSDSGFFVISTPNEEPLTAMTSFGDRLIVFSKTKAYIIEDSDTSSVNWGYVEAQWRGGAISHQCVLQTENDIFALIEDGTVYSISAVMQYGDYKISSITEPAQINDYIIEKINLSYLNNTHAIFDPTLRCIKFFCTSQSSSINDTALCYFIDRSISTGWSIHNNKNFLSGYNAKSSCIHKDQDDQINHILTGDYLGRIWETETSKIIDDVNPFDIIYSTPYINLGDPRNTKRFKRGYLELLTSNVINVNIAIATDNTINYDYFTSILFKGSRFDSARWNIDRFTQIPLYKLRYHIIVGISKT